MYHVEQKFFTDQRHWWFTKRGRCENIFLVIYDLFLEIFLTTSSLDTNQNLRPLTKIVCCQKVNGAEKKKRNCRKIQRNCWKINKINLKLKKVASRARNNWNFPDVLRQGKTEECGGKYLKQSKVNHLCRKLQKVHFYFLLFQFTLLWMNEREIRNQFRKLWRLVELFLSRFKIHNNIKKKKRFPGSFYWIFWHFNR